MRELQVVSDGALLVHDGVVRESGTSRRIENLAEARNAVEIDAGGRIILPAFVEPDTVLVTPGGETPRGLGAEVLIATTSKRRLEAQTRTAVEDWVRHGVLAVGAATHGATDLRDARKLLTVQKAFQARPLRIRSVFAPGMSPSWLNPFPEVITGWAAGIVEKRLAGVLELEIPAVQTQETAEMLARLARRAVPEGFILRLRSRGPLSQAIQRLAHETGAISVITPGVLDDPDPEFTRASCVWVLTAPDIFTEQAAAGVRRLLDEGWPLALASGYRGSGGGCCNPQYLLYLAVARLGMTLEEAITAITWNAACSLRMSTVSGSIEPGKQADLAIIDVRDYRDLAQRPGHNDVFMTLRGGRPVYRRAGLLAV